MTSDMPLPRLIEGRAARPALCHGEYRQGIVYSLENRLGGGLEAGRWAFRRGQRRRDLLWAGKNSAARRPYACRMKAPSS